MDTPNHCWGCGGQTLNAVMNAGMEDLALCPGLGPSKVQRIYEMFHQPLKRSSMVSSQAVSWLPAGPGSTQGTPSPRAKRRRTLDALVREATNTTPDTTD